MVNAKLLEYVKAQLAQGLSKDTIKQNLNSAGGWELSDIEETFSSLDTNPVPVKYAGFWIRFVAYIVDSVIVGISFLIIQIPLSTFHIVSFADQSGLNRFPGQQIPSMPVSQIILNIVMMFAGFVYYIWLTHSKGATLGKMLVGITVKSEDLQKLSLGNIILRETVGKIISGITFLIGYIMAGFTEKKQGLHDKIAQSVVVYKDPTNINKKRIILVSIVAFAIPVLALIGIISSIVLVSLNIARQKGVDMRTNYSATNQDLTGTSSEIVK